MGWTRQEFDVCEILCKKITILEYILGIPSGHFFAQFRKCFAHHRNLFCGRPCWSLWLRPNSDNVQGFTVFYLDDKLSWRLVTKKDFLSFAERSRHWMSWTRALVEWRRRNSLDRHSSLNCFEGKYFATMLRCCHPSMTELQQRYETNPNSQHLVQDR